MLRRITVTIMLLGMLALPACQKALEFICDPAVANCR